MNQLNGSDNEICKLKKKREGRKGLARKAATDRERQAKLANKLAIADEKERAKAEVAEAKEAYEYRCEERKFLREQIINEELK